MLYPIRPGWNERNLAKSRITDRWINFDFLAVAYSVNYRNSAETGTEKSGKQSN